MDLILRSLVRSLDDATYDRSGGKVLSMTCKPNPQRHSLLSWCGVSVSTPLCMDFGFFLEDGNVLLYCSSTRLKARRQGLCHVTTLLSARRLSLQHLRTFNIPDAIFMQPCVGGKIPIYYELYRKGAHYVHQLCYSCLEATQVDGSCVVAKAISIPN